MNQADLAALANKAAEEVDYTKEKAGGDFEIELPEEGKGLFRFREYIELGLQPNSSKNFPDKKPAPKARFVFEMVTPKHIRTVKKDDGTEIRIPHTVACTVPISQSSKSNFIKLFRCLNYDGKATHPAQLLGRAYLGEIIHGYDKDDLVDGKPKSGAKPRYANFQRDGVYTFTAPRIEDPVEGTVKELKAGELLNPIKLFLFGNPTKECWDSLFIEGTRTVKVDGKEVEKSKNWMQETILKALNYEGSAVQQLLEGGDLTDLPMEETDQSQGTQEQPAHSDDDDPLAGVV